MKLRRTSNPVRLLLDLLRIPRSLYRRRRLRPLELTAEDHQLVCDDAHGFALVHYYIDPEAQFLQLAEAGFEPLACLDLEGVPVTGSAKAEFCPELHYLAVAR